MSEQPSHPAEPCSPLISVITPVYNGSKYVEELILSVRNQTCQSVEHIVIDDGSTDNGATVAVLARYPHLRWWTRPNRGQYATLNEGIDAAQGDWICIISADDLLASPSAFFELVRRAGSVQDYDAVFGRTTLMNEAGEDLAESQGRLDESAPKWLNYHFLVIHHCSLLVARKFIVENKLNFDTSLKYTGDWDWIIRILKLARATYCDMVVSKYRVHAQQTRQTTMRRALVAEDKLVLSRHGSSVLLHNIVVNYLRLRKLLFVFSKGGGAGAAKALWQFLGKN